MKFLNHFLAEENSRRIYNVDGSDRIREEGDVQNRLASKLSILLKRTKERKLGNLTHIGFNDPRVDVGKEVARVWTIFIGEEKCKITDDSKEGTLENASGDIEALLAEVTTKSAETTKEGVFPTLEQIEKALAEKLERMEAVYEEWKAKQTAETTGRVAEITS